MSDKEKIRILIESEYTLKNISISEKYLDLMAEYFSAYKKISSFTNIEHLIPKLPELVKEVNEGNEGLLGQIKGITKDEIISMNSDLNDSEKALYFFHEFTHALQTTNINGVELCAFSNGINGMFFTEASTQFIAEILYSLYSDKQFVERSQPGSIIGINNVPLSPLSMYQYNSCMLSLFCKVLDISLPELLSMTYDPKCRGYIKEKYESVPGNENGFEAYFEKLEKIYYIDKCAKDKNNIGTLSSSEPISIELENGSSFNGNFSIEAQLIKESEESMLNTFLNKYDIDSVLEKTNEVIKYVTDSNLRKWFISHITSEDYYLEDTKKSI